MSTLILKHANMTKNQLYPIALLLFLFFLPSLLHAQAPGFDQDSNDAPLDGGLTLLVAAGVGYGAKKLRVRKQ